LCFELAIFFFQSLDTPITGFEQDLFRLVRASLVKLSFRLLLLHALLAELCSERFDALSHVGVCIQITLRHMRRLRNAIEIHNFLLSQKSVNGLVDTLLGFRCFALRMCEETMRVWLNRCFLPHVRFALSSGVYSRRALPAG
jgi:hypothetical protein